MYISLLFHLEQDFDLKRNARGWLFSASRFLPARRVGQGSNFAFTFPERQHTQAVKSKHSNLTAEFSEGGCFSLTQFSTSKVQPRPAKTQRAPFHKRWDENLLCDLVWITRFKFSFKSAGLIVLCKKRSKWWHTREPSRNNVSKDVPGAVLPSYTFYILLFRKNC